LIDVLDFQVARPQRHGFGNAFGDDACLQATQAGQRKSCAIVRIESLGLNHLPAGESEATLVGHLFAMVMGLLTCSCARRWEQKNRAVGHHAIHVEQHHLDLLCALIGHAASVAAGRPLFSLRYSF
jgi:hypothetical protein